MLSGDGNYDANLCSTSYPSVEPPRMSCEGEEKNCKPTNQHSVPTRCRGGAKQKKHAMFICFYITNINKQLMFIAANCKIRTFPLPNKIGFDQNDLGNYY